MAQFTFTYSDSIAYDYQTFIYLNVLQPVVPTLESLSKKQLEEELDIIRGVSPTPKGYSVSVDRAKLLMKELKRRG